MHQLEGEYRKSSNIIFFLIGIENLVIFFFFIGIENLVILFFFIGIENLVILFFFDRYQKSSNIMI